jgi:hypothetical protein
MRRLFSCLPKLRGLVLVFVLLHAASAGRAQSQETRGQETRHFDVSVDGSKAGMYQMTFQTQPDGAIKVTHQARVRYTSLAIFRYTYAFDGTEVWKNGQLQQWECTANDNGTRYATTARRDDKGFRIKVNDKERLVRPDFWLTTYCFTPEVQMWGENHRLIEADTGKEMHSSLNFIGGEERVFAGKKAVCAHMRLRGSAHVDVWYDAQGRLAHQESVEDGHRMVLQLSVIER